MWVSNVNFFWVTLFETVYRATFKFYVNSGVHEKDETKVNLGNVKAISVQK